MVEIKHLTKEYLLGYSKRHTKSLRSVSDVSFILNSNTSYALVGESGCGKSTLALMISGLLSPSSGEVFFNGQNIYLLSRKQQITTRKDLQMVLQNSSDALDPMQRIYDCIAEPIQKLLKMSKSEEKDTVYHMIRKVALPESVLTCFPHELSGGQQSRVCIARAMCLSPQFVIFDESVSGLDVTIQKRVLDLLLTLRKEYHSTYLFITHDIDVALYMADHILVMKNGEIVEFIPNAITYDSFKHPYSKSLISAIPSKSPYQR